MHLAFITVTYAALMLSKSCAARAFGMPEAPVSMVQSVDWIVGHGLILGTFLSSCLSA